MRIAIIGTTAHSILGFRVDLIKSLIAKGHEVYAFAQDYQTASKEAVETLGALAISYAFNRTGLNPLVDLINTFKLAKQLKEYKIEQTFCYFSKPVIFGTLAAIIARVPKRYAMLEGLGYTFTPQQQGYSFKTKLLKRVQVLLYQAILPHLNRFILLNEDDKKDLIDNYHINIETVILGPIGLNLADYPYTPVKSDPVSFLFIGRLLKEKGIIEYITAAKLIKLQYPTTEFVILGPIDTENPGGLAQADLQQLIDERVIIWPGFVDNVAQWIKKCSVFVLPSFYREGFPRSIQEAMAIGRAIITTNLPGCKESVQEGVNGFLIKPYDVNELANKMAYFIDHPEKISEMGNSSYQIALKNFNASKINNRLMELLDLA